MSADRGGLKRLRPQFYEDARNVVAGVAMHIVKIPAWIVPYHGHHTQIRQVVGEHRTQERERGLSC
jgi:hypothetical protein